MGSSFTVIRCFELKDTCIHWLNFLFIYLFTFDLNGAGLLSMGSGAVQRLSQALVHDHKLAYCLLLLLLLNEGIVCVVISVFITEVEHFSASISYSPYAIACLFPIGLFWSITASY